MATRTGAGASKRRSDSGSAKARTATAPAHAAVLEEARRAGLLDGEKTAHLSFRVPEALVEAAKRETGVDSPTALGILALALLAQPDPVAKFMKRTSGRLGKDHSLEY